MTGQDGFIAGGIKAARLALEDAVARAGLHLKPTTLALSTLRRARRTVKLVETVLRRLILLIAASLDLPDVTPRKSADADRKRTHVARPRGFVLVPPLGGDVSRLEGLERHRRLPERDRNATGTLLERLETLFRLLDDPSQAARRMARIIARLKAQRVMKPVVPPQVGLFRERADFSLVAEALPGRVNRALEGWYDSS